MSTATSTHSRTVTVSVPATTANLGPGFDCLGLALDLRNDITLTATGPDVEDVYKRQTPRWPSPTIPACW